MEKVKLLLQSRKFWLSMAPIMVVIAREVFGMSVSVSSMEAIATSVGALVVGMAIVDAQKGKSK
jgi:uncharacterized membrane protein